MDEITNNFSWMNSTAATSDNLIFTTGAESLSFPYYSKPDWLPYHEIKYKPKWHIKKGYKYQLKHMWD